MIENESLELKSLILQELVKRGVFMSPGPSFLSYSHSSEDIKKTLDALDKSCSYINSKVSGNNYQQLLEGKMPKTIYTHVMPSTKKNIG